VPTQTELPPTAMGGSERGPLGRGRRGLRQDAERVNAARLVVPAMVTSRRGTADQQQDSAPTRTHLVSWLLRPADPSVMVGLVVAASLILAETVLVYLLKRTAPEMAFGVVYLLGVLVVSAEWGVGLATMTSVVSALAFDYFRMRPVGVIATDAQNWVVVAVFMLVALIANSLAGLARTHAAEADQRRREADIATGQAHLLARQQASLRRVATLVARGASPSEVFSAVAGELARCLGVCHSALCRFQPDGASVLLAARDVPGLAKMRIGERFLFDGESVAALVFRTGRAARMDSHRDASGPAAARIRELGLCSGVGVPIVVDGRLWGAAVVGSSRPEPLPLDTEARLADFTDLVSTAIANAQNHADLTASRGRIVAAGDDARHRLERDLHDGAQQRLVSLGLQLRTAEFSVPPDLHRLKEQIADVVRGLAGVSEDLREISRGIHPAIVSRGGLGPAVKALARRSIVPVELDLRIDLQLPESSEVAAYFVISEALTNAAKHAQASEVTVRVEAEGANLHLSIQDDGIGGADTANGSGLTGLIDRVTALGGQMTISSRPGRGTSLAVKIPIEAA
jgi:signal transduction histidine kinase